MFSTNMMLKIKVKKFNFAVIRAEDLVSKSLLSATVGFLLSSLTKTLFPSWSVWLDSQLWEKFWCLLSVFQGHH